MRPEPLEIAAEQRRIKAEFERRDLHVLPDRYAPWQWGHLFMMSSTRRDATRLLHDAGAFPRVNSRCLEVGCGALGWLGVLVSWGVSERSLSGIDLDAARVQRAKRILPCADLRVGSASSLPWSDESFDLVVVSTVFTSILDRTLRERVGDEITRVLAPGGCLLWYDFRVNNPRNSQVRKVTRRELQSLFPLLTGRIRSTTLAPPVARRAARLSWTVATCLEAVPFLRTHLVAVLQKSATRSC